MEAANFLTSSPDPSLLDQLVLLKFEALTFASGEVMMPCVPAWIEEHLRLMVDLMRALGQKPPPQEIQNWREILERKLAEGAENPSMRLVFRYQPCDEFLGLTNGFQLGISLQELENAAINWEEVEGLESPFEELTIAQGELQMPCVPSFLDSHIDRLEGVLRALRQNLDPAEIEGWRRVLAPKLTEWFAESSNNCFVVQYEMLNPSLGLFSGVKISIFQGVGNLENHYTRWLETREGPLFGSHPDAKVMTTVAQLPKPATILDVGAGSGRNSLALARLGYQVDAVELTQVLTSQLQQTSEAEGLDVRVIQGDILDEQLDLQPSRYQLAIISEVIASHFRHPEEVRRLLMRMCDWVQPGGWVLFNVFVTVAGYEPSDRIREMAQVYWSYIITPPELQMAIADLPLQILSDESAFEYEQQHLPPEAWPPTSWFTSWSTGRNLFPMKETPPIKLRWILCQVASH